LWRLSCREAADKTLSAVRRDGWPREGTLQDTGQTSLPAGIPEEFKFAGDRAQEFSQSLFLELTWPKPFREFADKHGFLGS